MSKTSRILAAACALALLVGAGAAIAADGSSQITVHAPTQLKAGQTAPFDAPGVAVIRQGKPIPKGYVLVGQQVDVQRGAKTAGAALRFTCPGGKRLQTFGIDRRRRLLRAPGLRRPSLDQRDELPAAARPAGDRHRVRGLPLST